MMVSRGDDPQMSLFQPSELFFFSHINRYVLIYIYTYIYIYVCVFVSHIICMMWLFLSIMPLWCLPYRGLHVANSSLPALVSNFQLIDSKLDPSA